MNKLLSLFIIIISSILVQAQQAEYYSYTLKNITPLRSKIFYKPLNNTGINNDINIDSIVYHYIENLANKTYGSSKKAMNSNLWLLSPLFSMTENENEADVIIDGTYHLDKVIQSTEKLLYESSSNFASPIPYFEIESINMVDLNIILNYKYKNNIVTETIFIAHESKRSHRAKQKTINELVLKCNKSLKLSLYDKFDFINRKVHYYKFPKVKIKDKVLKEEYKNAKDLLKNGDIIKLGNFYKRVYNNNKTKEAAYCLGACYELIGNFPKAQEYYKQMPDFHTKTRMKNSMLLYDYLLEIGTKLQLQEF